MIFSFGQSEQERMEIDVIRYERQPTGEYSDDNWLVVEIRVRAGGFRGEISATIITAELYEFLSELRPLYETLKGVAELKMMEEQLSLRLVGDGRGQIELCGEVMDKAGVGNRLNFSLHFDQSQLNTSIRELERVKSQFPIREEQK
ncbi:conserved hypothetical protein [Pedosphaera parvula Ellin514]|uniref:Uncharacterized protein n=2 Tax=Pedosphaera TaxID=1032526 RepID=B9XFU9_PEDPL|nr:conserved hypothetical protein [Pedosphaera parvula Ellin514]